MLTFYKDNNVDGPIKPCLGGSAFRSLFYHPAEQGAVDLDIHLAY